MNESIGNAFLYTFVIAFVGILLVLFLGGLAYTKAYKVKDMIVNELESKGEDLNLNCYDGKCTYNKGDYASVISDIDNMIDSTGVGYRRISSRDNSKMCEGNRSYMPKSTYVTVNNTNGRNEYQYCVFAIPSNGSGTSSDPSNRNGYYFRVVTFMYVDLPIIDNLIKIPVIGETETFYTLSY